MVLGSEGWWRTFARCGEMVGDRMFEMIVPAAFAEYA